MSNKRSGNGNKLQQRNEYGDPMYIAQRNISKPLLCHSEFWKQRGGERSYSTLQESFYSEISKQLKEFGYKLLTNSLAHIIVSIRNICKR